MTHSARLPLRPATSPAASPAAHAAPWQRRLRAASRGVVVSMAVALTAACGSGISLDEPIEGPVWWLTQLHEQPVAAGREPQRDAQLAFDRDSGRVSGSGGCNRISGSFTRSGSSLRLGQLAASRMACADPARTDTETQFFQVLQTTTGYRLSGPGRMSLIDANGRTLAVLSTQPAR